MNNISFLEEEYNNYLRLINEKERLEESIRGLSDHNNEDNLKRLNEINNEISLYNQNVLPYMQNYFNLRNRISELSNDIKAIEELSKEGKRPNKNVEFITLSSAEGRNKQIDKELASDYIKLSEEKAKIKNELSRIQNVLSRYHSLKNKNPNIENKDLIDKKTVPVAEEKSEKEKIREAISNIEKNNNLSLEEKRKLIEEQINRIFEISNLPNQGKKNLVTYAGKKYSIPEDLMGIYRFTYMRLRNLDNKIEEKSRESKIMNEETIPVENDDKDLFTEWLKDYGIDYNKLRATSESKKKIEEPVKDTIPSTTESPGSKYFKPADPKVFDTSIDRDKEMHEKLGVPFDPEKQKRMNELAAKIFNSRNEEAEVVRFREGVKQKVNTAKGYVTTTSKKAVSALKEKTKKVMIKAGSIKNAAIEKSKEVSYLIVNRAVKFKENTCQRINESKSKITDIKKEALEKIRKPFVILKEKKNNYVTKKELWEMVNLLKEQNELLLNQNKALSRKLTNSSGFVSTAAFIIVTSILITIAIFLVVGFIVFGR